MTISRERFDALQAKWGAHSSWAVWKAAGLDEKPKAHIGDRSILNPDTNLELLDVLNPAIVMVGLNASSRGGNGEAWANFHDGDRNANDFKLRFALEGTWLWGAYMTDALVNFPETDSAKVLAFTKANPHEVAKQLSRFEEELQDLGAINPLVIVFGGGAYSLLRRHLGDKYWLVRVTHYAFRINKVKLRADITRAVAEATSTSQIPSDALPGEMHLKPSATKKQFYEARCRNEQCDFVGGMVDVTIDYKTPYETGYSWTCPNCGTKTPTEFSFPPRDD
jgi:hypothetical protein